MSTVTSLGFSIFSRYDGSGVRRADNSLTRLARRVNGTNKSFSALTGSFHLLSTAAITLTPALIPITAQLLSISGGLIATTAAAGAAGGIWALALKGAIKQTATAEKTTQKLKKTLISQKATLATLKPGTRAYATELKKVQQTQTLYNASLKAFTGPQRKFVAAQSHMRAAWTNFITATSSSTLGPAGIAVNAVASAMHKLVPVVRAVAPIAYSIANAFKRWTTDGGLDRAVRVIIQYGVPGLRQFVAIGRNVITVLGTAFRRFLPVGAKVVGQIRKGSDALRKWSNGGGFFRFLNYVRANQPQVKKFFKALLDAFIHISKAMAQVAPLSLIIATGLAQLISAIPVPVLTAIWQAFVLWKAAIIGLMVIDRLVMMIRIFVKVIKATIVVFKILRFVMLTFPGAALILGITLLVTAIVLIATKTHWFQNIWKATWGFVKRIASAVWDFIMSHWKAVLKVLQFISPIAFLALHWRGAWTVMKAVFHAVVNGITSAWKHTLAFMSSIFGHTWSHIAAFGKSVWHGISQVFGQVWSHISGFFKGALNGMSKVFGGVWSHIANFGKNLWRGMSKVFGGIWSHVASFFSGELHKISNMFSKIWKSISGTGLKIWHTMSRNIGTVFSHIRDFLHGIWGSIEKAAKHTWNRIKGIIGTPIKWVINTPIADIVKVFNSVTSAVGLKGLHIGVPHVSFAQGGHVMGPGGPKDDRVPAMLSRGEYVMPAQRVKDLGVAFFEKIRGGRAPVTGGAGNANYATGGIVGPHQPGVRNTGSGASIGNAFHNVVKFGGSIFKKVKDTFGSWTRAFISHFLPHFPGKFPGGGTLIPKVLVGMGKKMMGGLIDALFGGSNSMGGGANVGKALHWAKTQVGKKYQWGGNGNPSWDCSGFMSAIESVIRGEKPHRRWATGAFPPGAPGWKRNLKSPFMIGITNAGVGHTAGTLAGVNVESSGGAGVRVGGGARGYNNPMFTSHWGFTGALGGGGGGGPARTIAKRMLAQFGWGPGQFPPLDRLWQGESGWRWNAKNPSSGAYGIPQSLPANKMASAGSDWKTNPATQIRWGLGYIKSSYGSPSNAYAKWSARNPHWYKRGGMVGSYDRGGYLPEGLSLAYNGTGRPEPVGHDMGGVHFHDCTFVGTSRKEWTDIFVKSHNEAKRKKRIG